MAQVYKAISISKLKGGIHVQQYCCSRVAFKRHERTKLALVCVVNTVVFFFLGSI